MGNRKLRRSKVRNGRLLALEPLEDRRVMADLTGVVGVASSSGAGPGGSVTLNWQVANLGFDTVFTGFSVDFWLSRDAAFSADDRLLSGEFLPAGFPGLFAIPPQTRTLSLPASGDAIWGATSYHVLMLVDPYNAVFESNEFNNTASAAFNIGGDSGGPMITDITALPTSPYRPGALLANIARTMITELESAAASQVQMRTKLNSVGVVLPNVADNLRSLKAGFNALLTKLTPLTSGQVKKVNIAPGLPFTSADLALAEKYLYYLVNPDSTTIRAASTVTTPVSTYEAVYRGASASLGLSNAQPLQATAAAQSVTVKDIAKSLFPKQVEQLETLGNKIQNTWEGIKNLPNKATQWISGIFGQTGKLQAETKQQADAVNNGGSQFGEKVTRLEREMSPQNVDDLVARIDSLLDGAPSDLAKFQNQMTALAEESRDSIDALADQVVNLETWARNQALIGAWKGPIQRDALKGTLDVYFRPSSAVGNTISGTIGHTFHYGSNSSARTTGSFIGALDENNVFRGTATVRNASGSGTFQIAWNFSNGVLSGTLYEGNTITFRITRKR